jgi:hypothetical protein
MHHRSQLVVLVHAHVYFFTVIGTRRTSDFWLHNLPCFLLISPSFLHAHKICLCVVSLHVTAALKYFDQGFANSLWHFARGSAYVYDAVLVCKGVIYLPTLLANKVLDVNFLALGRSLVNSDG